LEVGGVAEHLQDGDILEVLVPHQLEKHNQTYNGDSQDENPRE
jgi:hypothetical protein